MTTIDDTVVDDEIDRLADLDDTTFRAEVDADLRSARTRNPKAITRAAALRSNDLVDRWYTTLQMMSVSVEGQLAAAQEDHAAERAALRSRMASASHREQPALQEQWEESKGRFSRARAAKLRFKSGLDEWIVEARSLRDSLRDSMYDSIVAEERNHWAERYRVLHDAVAAHEAATLADDLEPTEQDTKLWASI